MNTAMIWQITSTGSADTSRLGELLGNRLSGGEVIELISDLGGGKTTFTQGLARGLGSSDNVASPTFTLMKTYKGYSPVSSHLDAAQGSREERAKRTNDTQSERKSATDKAMREVWIHHFDFYRLNEPGVVADQLAESIDDDRVVTVVEWSDIVQDVLPKDRITIKFNPTPNNPDERLITIYYPERFAKQVRQVESEWVEVKE